MNISNKLTTLRIILSFICIGFIIKNSFYSMIIAFFIFIFASLTDFLDGYFARKKELVSDLGKILDPIADKILIIGVLLAFLQLKIIVDVWMASVIMLREFIITAVRLYNLSRGEINEAKKLGKHKTASQVFAVIYIFIVEILFKKFPNNNFILFLYNKVSYIIMWYVVLITLFSGLYYFWSNRHKIKTF